MPETIRLKQSGSKTPIAIAVGIGLVAGVLLVATSGGELGWGEVVAYLLGAAGLTAGGSAFVFRTQGSDDRKNDDRPLGA